MKIIKHKSLLLLTAIMFSYIPSFCVGEAGTYFNIYVTPNNEILGRDVALIVTALENNTQFRIQDTNEDGDSDDNATGILKAGQSYILYIREGAVNDDAPHAGEPASKQDGDHFIITGNKLLLVSSANTGEFQHNWLPATNKTSKGKKFFIYSNKVQNSPNDINVMAFEDGTVVNIRKISQAPKLSSGYTNINLSRDSLIVQRTLSRGRDLIYYFANGKDALKPGETYMVTSNKEVTVQYGALYVNEHDAGGYVPSENGSSSGATFYFTIPFQDSAQQEVRVISWDNNNRVVLERFANGSWVTLKNFNTLNKNQTAEWVGQTNAQTYATVFRVRGSSGKKLSVVEGNWIETGKMLTSDVAMMVSPDNGTSAGKNFLAYLPIPSKQDKVFNPITNSYLPLPATHAYIFGNKNHTSHITIKDAYTNGATINRNITVQPGGYADVVFDSLQWLSIYNGTGTMAAGPQRPYITIKSDRDVAVMVSNFNDNSMLHYGSSMAHGFEIEDDDSESEHDAHSGDTVCMTWHVRQCSMFVNNSSIRQIVDDGLFVMSAKFKDSTANTFVDGSLLYDSIENKTFVEFPVITELDSNHVYVLETQVIPTCFYHARTPIEEGTILNVETFMNGTIDSTEEVAANSIGIAYHVLDSASIFTVSTEQATPGENILCFSNKTALTYLWDLGNGITADSSSVNVSYMTPGDYTISLTTFDRWGCTAKSWQAINVAEQVSAVNNITEESIRIWSTDNEVFVDFTGIENVNAKVDFYNAIGQHIDEVRNNNSTLFRHSITAIKNDYLIVSVYNNGKQFNKKVFIDN